MFRMPSDKTDALLTEIRDLLKEQHDVTLAMQRSVGHMRTFQIISIIAKASLYILVIAFTFLAAASYYSTITTLTSGSIR